jgi:hypothetical protein
MTMIQVLKQFIQMTVGELSLRFIKMLNRVRVAMSVIQLIYIKGRSMALNIITKKPIN